MSIRDRAGRIEDKIDQLSDRLNSIDKTLVSQHESLKEHIRRTEILETKIEPIEKHVVVIQGLLKAVGALGAAVGVIVGLLKTFLR